ncbi:MAG: hypothetical protein C7B43_21225 [Sulfobacillus benefaciens]|uniref:Uncharacterized protein n=1 Tax=Sulfobacillus benefaciens TaxID=453960 RepID=A0A2T2WH45_9FIRM|nr:MAG: hypothetical protein C7B43_21225 [Sulfobacillus benefaciens]
MPGSTNKDGHPLWNTINPTEVGIFDGIQETQRRWMESLPIVVAGTKERIRSFQANCRTNQAVDWEKAQEHQPPVDALQRVLACHQERLPLAKRRLTKN